MNMKQLLPAFALMLSACATTVPVAVSCPPPPPVPEILELPVSTGPSLSKQYDDLIREFRDSLNKATRTP